MSARKNIGYTHVPVTQNGGRRFENANRITLINKGTQVCTIGGCFVLSPGQSITYPAWPDEVNNGVFDFVFPAGVNGCLVIAVCKNYSP